MDNKIILISGKTFGKGDSNLGEHALFTFCSLLPQNDKLPAAIFCMNEGVFTLTEQSEVATQLQELEKLGVTVYGCKTCLDHYNITDEIVVGKISSMLKFIELASKYEVITIA